MGPTPTDGGAEDMLQRAVEDFVDRCAAGEQIEPDAFAANWPESIRRRVADRCRRFLQFDDFVGHQDWDGADVPATAGRRFGDFVIQEELGRGGMGVVYLAHQQSLNRRVALKVMASGLSLSKRHVERFHREASAAARLRHPGIVPVHSFTEIDGTFALAMDYIAGRNLGEILDGLRLQNGPQPEQVEGTLGLQPGTGYVAECAQLAAQIAAALAAAHGHGIAHRDIKPRNIMVDDSRQARLLDFGLAKSLGQDSISQSGEITGTAHYMSPEQTLAKRVQLDHRTDIFSLGVILYELLTLRRPFDGKNLQQVVYEICFKEPVPPQRLNAKVPRDLATICLKALEKDPQNRYQTAAEFEADLQRFLRWEPIHARPAGALLRLWKFVLRHRTESVAAGLLLLSGCAAIAVGWWRDLDARERGARLLGEAHAAADRYDFDLAIKLATEALTVVPDDQRVRSALELLGKSREIAATDEQRRKAEANLMLVRSSQLRSQNREQALQLALDAVRLVDSQDARSAVLDALGPGYRTTSFDADRNVIRLRASADGSVVATCALDGPAAIWTASTGALQHRLDGRGAALDVAFHPDNQRVATADVSRGATIWRLADGKELRHFDHQGVVENVRFDAAGARLLTTDYVDYEKGPFGVHVFDVATGTELASIAHPRYVELAVISPCGNYVASTGDLGFVRVWEAATGRELARLPHSSRVRAIEFQPERTLPDGRRASMLVATAALDGTARLFALPTGQQLAEARHSGGIEVLHFDSTGDHLLTAGRDRTARIWRLALGTTAQTPATTEAVANRTTTAPPLPPLREVQTLLGHTGNVLDAQFDPEGQYVVTAGADGILRVFDTGTGAELTHYEFGPSVDRAVFAPDSSAILALAGPSRAVRLHLDDARGVVLLRHVSFVNACAFDPSGNFVVTACDDETVSVWNARNGSQVRTIKGFGDPVIAVDVDPKSQRFLAATLSGHVGFHGLWNGDPLQQLAGHRGRVNVANFAADGELVVTAGNDGRAVVWNARDARPVAELALGAPVIAAAVAPSGQLLATVTAEDTAVHLWTVANQQSAGTIAGHEKPVRWVAFRPDGKSILSVGDDGLAQLCDLDGRVRQTYRAAERLHRGVFARGGDVLLTCGSGSEATAQLWNVDSGARLLTFHGHRASIVGGALSEDGSAAITASKDRTAQIWPTNPVAVARRLVAGADAAAPVTTTPAQPEKPTTVGR